MINYVVIHFKCQGRVNALVFKTSVEEITLSMVKARIYTKLAFDESKVKLQLSYIPMLIGCKEQMVISDDEDLFVYLTSIDKENRRCLLYVEVMTTLELSDQESRVGKSSFDITIDVDNRKAKQQEEVIKEEDDDDDTSPDECEDNDIDTSDMRDEYVEAPPVVESSQFVSSWEDGLGVNVCQEFPNKKAIAELVDRVAFVNSFGYVIKHSDTTRWVARCSLPRCKWGLRAARIPQTDIFSIRTYTKMHTCNRASQSTRKEKRRGSARLVASLLNEDYSGKLETPSPKIIMDLVKKKFGVEISYSTALRGKNQVVHDLRGSLGESSDVLDQPNLP